MNETTATAPGKTGDKTSTAVNQFMEQVIAKNPGEVEFHQAVQEVVASVMPVVESNPVYQEARILERLV